MKRIATVIVAAVALLTLAAPSADAASEECVYSVPALPGECLSAATYGYLTDLQSRYDEVSEKYADDHTRVEELTTENLYLSRDLADAERLRDEYGADSSARYLRILALRAKIKELRQIIRG